jgi:hypothetical protein
MGVSVQYSHLSTNTVLVAEYQFCKSRVIIGWTHSVKDKKYTQNFSEETSCILTKWNEEAEMGG